ncbi:hypothetical protein [Pyruvatibacter sp.]|uniref:hypothetical protein n=1 Tax=Pyruvatibacter sp. TaxID=1981328 RepID=UPI0032673BF1
MRLACLCTATLSLTLASLGFGAAFAQNSSDDQRHGPFVKTDEMLSDLLEQGYEIKGILGGALILVQDAKMYSCALVPDHEALSYKTQFECSVLDEIRSSDSSKNPEN